MVFILKHIIKLIFPPKCIFCGSILSAKAEIDICGECYRKIPFVKGELPNSKSTYLNDCKYDEIICLCDYSGIIKHSLIRYKFYAKPSYHRAFAKLLAERIKKMTKIREFDIIISVPLHKYKERVRGYNQSRLISKMLSKEIGIPEYSTLLSRVKNTVNQSLLDKKGRIRNVKDAFVVKDAEKVRGKRILLIDDILTTGSTLNECSGALKKAGAKDVTIAVIASGRKF